MIQLTKFSVTMSTCERQFLIKLCVLVVLLFCATATRVAVAETLISNSTITDIEHGKIKTAKKFFNHFIKKIDSKKFQKNLSPSDSQLLITMINQLLDNFK